MSNLKGILFNQFAGDGLTILVEELKDEYKPKKGRRFNHGNITYEIGRPTLKENALEFEISAKIPQDEIKTPKAMKAYFGEVKKIMNKEKKKPLSIVMENIVWDSKTNAEKERDYIKLIYQYSLDELYDDKALLKRCEAITKSATKEKLPDVPGIFTLQGKMALIMVRETIGELCRKHIDSLMKANKKVKVKA